MGENYGHRPSFSSLNPPMIRHRPSSAAIESPEHPSGISTPPLQIPASVPFKWEQKPGKPRTGTHAVAGLSEPARFLEPPPCRILPAVEPSARLTKTTSPSSILDGPYNVARPRFSSSRFSRDGPDPLESYGGGGGATPHGSTFVAGRKSTSGIRLVGRVKGGQREVADGGSLGFSSSSNSSLESEEGNVSRRMKSGGGRKMKRRNSFSSVSHGRSSHVWATICEGFKHVIHWKSNRKAH